jgi:thioredoxin-related protein
MKPIVSFLYLMLAGLLLSAQKFEMTVNFLAEENWDQTRAQAGAQSKYILVDAYTDWCYWCKVQDKKTFTDPDIGQLLNEHFVSIKLDFEHGDGLRLARKYRVQSYPTLLFFNQEGQLVGRSAGYTEDKDEFIAMVEAQLSPANHLTPIGNAEVLDPGFPDFYVNHYGASGERSPAKPKQVADWLAAQEDLFTEVAYNVLITMPLDSTWSQYFVENHQAYAERFHAEEVNQKLTSALLQPAYEAMGKKDEAALNASLARLSDYLPEKEVTNISTSLRLNFFIRSQQFPALVALASSLADDAEGAWDAALNQAAWTMYESCDDEEALLTAIDWMRQVLNRHPDSYAELDTQAALLLKTHAYDEANTMAQRAIRAGKASGVDVASTEELLEQIKQGMQDR